MEGWAGWGGHTSRWMDAQVGVQKKGQLGGWMG